MKRKCLAVGIILLFIGTVIIPSNGQKIETQSFLGSRGNTLYVGGSGPGNYTEIQSAVDAASDGFTIRVYPKTYSENVRLNKQLYLQGVKINGTIPDVYGGDYASPIYVANDSCVIENFSLWNGDAGGGQSAVSVSANNTTVKNCTLYHTGCGIFCQGYSRNVFRDNEIIGWGWRGIELGASNNNSIINNNIYGWQQEALYLHGSSDNWISQNIFNNSMSLEVENSRRNIFKHNIFQKIEEGFRLDNAWGTIVRENTIDTGITVDGPLDLLLSYTIEDNLDHGEPLMYYKSLDGVVVSEITGEIILVNCTHFLVNPSQVSDHRFFLFYSSNNTIANNTDLDRIQLSNSSDNLITQNHLLKGGGGISLLSNSNKNLVIHNTIAHQDPGITIDSSWSNIVDHNSLTNCYVGMFLTDNEYLVVSNNTIENSSTGIWDLSVHSRICHNILRHGAAGITAGGSSIVDNNTVFDYDDGIYMGETINFTITNNTILRGKKGIVIASAEDGLVQFNQIQGNHIGIILFLGSGFIIEKNNFVRNVVDATFYSQLIQRRNRWIQNYWGPFPKVVKPIIGLIQITFPVGDYSFLGIIVPWIKFDWSPAKEPYNISGMS